MKCNHTMQHVEDVEYRAHEIVIAQCNDCRLFVVDARSDNYEGGMLAGYIDKSIYWALDKAKRSIDKHELDKSLMVNIPF